MGDRLKPKKKFKDTKVGQFLTKAGSRIVDGVGELATGGGVFGVVKALIKEDKDLTETDKDLALKLLDMDVIEMEQITERLKSDNEHLVTRLVRPISYGLMFILFMACIFLDGNVGDFQIDKAYIPVINSLFGTMTIFYFGSRGIEKVFKTIYK